MERLPFSQIILYIDCISDGLLLHSMYTAYILVNACVVCRSTVHGTVYLYFFQDFVLLTRAAIGTNLEEEF